MDTALWYAGLIAEVAVVCLLLWRGVYRSMPVFSSYVVWTALSDAAGMVIQNHSSNGYFGWFLFQMPFDSLLMFGVLVELAWSVLRPYRAQLPRITPFILSLLVLIAGVAVWPITAATALHNLPATWVTLMRLQQTFSILRIICFLLLAGFSQLLAIGWRNRELQIATGLGFYSLVSLAAALLHVQIRKSGYYHVIDQVPVAAYVCSLLYWVGSFLQKEAPRQEFTPRMQSILLAVSGSARANRIALQNSAKSGK